MRVILLQDVKNMGKKGDVKEAAEGYARNFLFPRKLAASATPEMIRKAEQEKEKIRTEEKAVLEKFRLLASQINNKQITITAKEKKGKLFGSITARNILTELEKENIRLEEKNIVLKEPIKKVGEYTVKIDFGDNISANIQISIAGE